MSECVCLGREGGVIEDRSWIKLQNCPFMLGDGVLKL